MSVCDACDGEDQKPFEPLKFSGVYRDWLCAACRSTLLTPPQASREVTSSALVVDDVPVPMAAAG